MAKHHYSSKFYYKSFACNPEGSLVHAMRRDGTWVRRRRPIKKICVEVDYNTEEQEKEQSQFETKYAKQYLRQFIQV